jgi:hypothetical protein
VIFYNIIKVQLMYNKIYILLGMVVYGYNPSTWKTEVGGLKVQGQPGLHSKTLHQNQNKISIRFDKF